MNNFNIIAFPSIIFLSLALGGCSRDEAISIADGGVYLSTNEGASFQQSVATDVAKETIAGFDLGKIHRGLFDSTVVFMAAGENGMVFSEDDGLTWQIVPTSLATTVDVLYMKNGVFLASGIDVDGQGSVMRSIDRGESWQNVFTLPRPVEKRRFQIISGGNPVPAIIVALESDPKSDDKVWAGTNEGTIFTAENSGQIWKTVAELASSSQIVTGDRSDAGIVRMEVSSTSPEDEVVVVTQKKQLIRVRNGVQVLVEVPESITASSAFGVAIDNRNILDISFIPGYPDALLLGTEKGAVITFDGGLTFLELKLPFDASKVATTMVVAVSPVNANSILIAADGILYRSDDGGQAWQTASIGPIGFAITDISINPKDVKRVLAVLKAIVT